MIHVADGQTGRREPPLPRKLLPQITSPQLISSPAQLQKNLAQEDLTRPFSLNSRPQSPTLRMQLQNRVRDQPIATIRLLRQIQVGAYEQALGRLQRKAMLSEAAPNTTIPLRKPMRVLVMTYSVLNTKEARRRLTTMTLMAVSRIMQRRPGRAGRVVNKRPRTHEERRMKMIQ